MSKITQLDITGMKQTGNGQVEISYALAFEETDKDSGPVTHIFDATAVVERASGEWSLSEVKPRSQTLSFSEPLEIVTTPVKKLRKAKRKADSESE